MADGTQEGRCGSKHRKQRTVTEKLDVLLVLLDVLADDSILKKVEGFENHPKAKGTSYTTCTAIKWAKPEEARPRRIRKAAAKEHAWSRARCCASTKRTTTQGRQVSSHGEGAVRTIQAAAGEGAQGVRPLADCYGPAAAAGHVPGPGFRWWQDSMRSAVS